MSMLRETVIVLSAAGMTGIVGYMVFSSITLIGLSLTGGLLFGWGMVKLRRAELIQNRLNQNEDI